jgi:hypothetical protein
MNERCRNCGFLNVDDEKSNVIPMSLGVEERRELLDFLSNEGNADKGFVEFDKSMFPIAIPCPKDMLTKDTESIDVPPGAAIVPGPEKPNLCKRVEEFRCRASNELPMEKCKYFAQKGTAWYCASRAYDDFQCLNPTAKAEVLMDDVRTVDNLQARINELEAKWEGGNLEAHGILKQIHSYVSSLESETGALEKITAMLEKAAKKFGWENNSK